MDQLSVRRTGRRQALTQPAGVLIQPVGVLTQESGVVNQPSGAVTQHQEEEVWRTGLPPVLRLGPGQAMTQHCEMLCECAWLLEQCWENPQRLATAALRHSTATHVSQAQWSAAG